MLPSRPVMKDLTIVKIAVEPLTKNEGLMPQLIEFDQKQPLSTIIAELCTNWKIHDSENYALKFTEQNNIGYVTEKNRTDVKNGSVLKIHLNAERQVAFLLNVFQNGSAIEQKECLESLATLSGDPTFANEFISKSGLDMLIKLIEDEKCTGARLEFALRSFCELMDHGIVSWEILSDSFISRNIDLINPKSVTLPSNNIIESSLSILENIVQNSSRAGLVERSVTFQCLLELLRKPVAAIQQNTIALVNALFLR
jgi:engulfment/cell motility protein 1